MRIEDIHSVQEIYSRIQEIQSLEKQFESQTPEKAFTQKAEKSEFFQELKKLNADPVSEEAKEVGQKPEIKKSQAFQKKSVPKKKHSLVSYIEKEAKSKGLDPDLVKAIIKAESNFNPRAESHKGAMGLMQLMPATAESLGISNPFNPFENIKGGTSYLRELSRIFKNKDHVIAAYNAGPGAVKKYKGIPPYSETQNYVQKVNEFLEDYKDE